MSEAQRVQGLAAGDARTAPREAGGSKAARLRFRRPRDPPGVALCLQPLRLGESAAHEESAHAAVVHSRPAHAGNPHPLDGWNRAEVHRGTIFVEDCEILAHEAHPAGQWRLRIHAPRIAANAAPGSFVHVSCDPLLAMRRPMSLMRVDLDGGWVDILYKEVGYGTTLLAKKHPGARLSVIGPIGRPFEAVPGRPRPLLLGGGVGIPPMVFLADRLRHDKSISMFVVIGSEVPFPFATQASDILVHGLVGDVTATMSLLEQWGIAGRLASGAGLAGCHQGYVTDLARIWLDALDDEARGEVAVYACGPVPMLEACVDLAREYALPCRVSLEEYMACAVGGCAGCAVQVRTDAGPAMKRVCVDGPVFDGHTIVFGA